MANFDIASFNLLNWANSVADLYDSTPKDVEITQKDDNGNLFTKTIANRGKFKQELWDDVGNALGQFSRTFYVDTINGDDNNSGTSDSPFKTIQKACDSVPIGGFGRIYLKTDSNIVDTDINLINKTIIINGMNIDSNSNTPAIKNTCYSDNSSYGFIMKNSYLILESVTIQTADYVDSSNVESPYAGFIKWVNEGGKNKVALLKASVLIGDTDFIKLLDRGDINLLVFYYDANHSVTDKSIDCVGANNNGFLISNSSGTMLLSTSAYQLGTKNDGSTNLTWSDLVSGIIKDANGVPRNIISNIIF